MCIFGHAAKTGDHRGRLMDKNDSVNKGDHVMESNNTISYDVVKSSERMDEILDAGNGNYVDKDSVPLRSSLTYINGYYDLSRFAGHRRVRVK
jgi:hypothetical protein